MSQNDLSSPDASKPVTPVDIEEINKRREAILGNVMEKLKPWLFEFGSWIFGGLLAFNLVIVAPLLTIGLGHVEILVSILAFACALPLNVSGILVLKLTKDMHDMAIDEVMKQAFEDMNGTQVDPAFAIVGDNPITKRRSDGGLAYSMRLAGVSIVLTTIGMIAALWYVAWWIGAVFIIVILVTLGITITVITRLMRPSPEEADKLRERYGRRQP